MPSILCLGEILYDWLCPEKGATLASATTFVRSPGGAPANVAVGLSRLGVATGFMGRVSTDAWGASLLEFLSSEGVDVGHVVRDSRSGTRMAYILLDEHGERRLAAFTHGNCADARLTHSDVRPEQFDDVLILYTGSLMQAHPESARAVDRAMVLAQEEGAVVLYDPNYRSVLWPDPSVARGALTHAAERADILKLGAEELEFLMEESDLEVAARMAQERFLPALLVVTDGPRGCFYVRDADEGHVRSPEIVQADSTGAGDAFVAGLLAGLVPVLAEGEGREAIATMEASALRRILARANALGALVATRTGAMTALPTAEELEAWMHGQPGGVLKDGLGWS